MPHTSLGWLLAKYVIADKLELAFDKQGDISQDKTADFPYLL